MKLYYSQKQFIQIKEPGTLNTEDDKYKVLGECLGKQIYTGHRHALLVIDTRDVKQNVITMT